MDILIGLLIIIVIILIVIFIIRMFIKLVKKIFSKNKKAASFKIMEKFNCPYCYKSHNTEDCLLTCPQNITGSNRSCDATIRRNQDGLIPSYYKYHCLYCKDTTRHPQLYCPETEKEIPIDYISMKNFSIALLGAKASGKSNYIGVLINEIRTKMTSAYNCSLSITISRETKKAYEDIYYRPLYIEGHTVLATAGGETPPPLIYPIRFMDENNKVVNMAALTFYDTAGENLDDNDVIRKFNNYIMNANGIIMLLDPLQVPAIRKELIKNGFNDLPEQNTETAYVLSRIMDTMRNIKNVKGQIDIPIALVFTKIDVLEKYNVLKDNGWLINESGHINRGVFLKSDFDNTNMEVKDLLERWDGEIIGFLKQFKKYAFFGVSALGANPAGTTIDSMGIRPRRVLDPLLWLLAENGYIKTLNR
jgi:GTPase SAR1 family protein